MNYMSKRPTPWKQRQRENAERNEKKPKKEEWYRKYWYIPAGLASMLTWVVTNGVDALDNVSTLPAKFETVKNQAISWRYNDEGWTGWWTTSTEGLVDSGDVTVSPIRAQLSLSVTQGKAHGEFSSDAVCSIAPMLGVLMLDGEINGDILHGIAYQFVGGKRENFATFTVTPTKNGVTIIPLQDPLGLIGKRLDLIAAFTEEQKDHGRSDCAGEQQKFISENVRRLNGPIDSDGRRRLDSLH